MQSLLITGGCGYIGSHTCITLLNKGFNLIILDSNVNSSEIVLKRIIEIGNIEKKSFEKRITFVKGDIKDSLLLKNIFSESIKCKKQIDGVIHFAGLKAVAESLKLPLLYWENNVGGSLNLFKVMNQFDCKTIVFSSSATIYGKSNQKLINEDSILNPYNTYGYTKLTVEKILNDLYQSSGKTWRIGNLRYFNPVGAHESGLIGENPKNIPNNLFPFICKVANKTYKELKIFGKDWDTHDGTCIRDYIHVMDLAEAHHATLDYLINNDPMVLNLNIGTGKGTSVLEMVNKFSEVNKCNIRYIFSDRRIGDVTRLVADNNLALKILNWNPKRDINKICKDGWNWQTRNPKGYI